MIEAKDIDLNLLVVFHEIMQERQISAVARKLELSQPAVSNALARLRRALGDELFVRTSLGMQPTPFAQAWFEPLSIALTQIKNALNRSLAFEPATSERQFTIAMTDVGEMYFMPILLAHCLRQAPQVKIASLRAHNIDLMSEMESGRIDLALGAFEPHSQALFQKRLFRQDYVSLFRQGHPQMRPGMMMRDYVELAHLLVSSKESPYDRITHSLEKAGVRYSETWSVPHFSSVPYILCSSDLLAIVPQKLAQSAATYFKLDYIKPPIRLPTLQTHVFWHRRFAQDAGNLWLRKILVEHFSERNG